MIYLALCNMLHIAQRINTSIALGCKGIRQSYPQVIHNDKKNLFKPVDNLWIKRSRSVIVISYRIDRKKQLDFVHLAPIYALYLHHFRQTFKGYTMTLFDKFFATVCYLVVCFALVILGLTFTLPLATNIMAATLSFITYAVLLGMVSMVYFSTVIQD